MPGAVPQGSRRLGWLVEIARPRPAPVPWGRVIRTTIGVPLPFALGLLLGQPGLGLIAATGTLPAVTTDRSGTYRSRVLRMAASTLAASLGYLLGGAAYGHRWTAVVLSTVVAGFAALIAAVGSTTSAASLQLLVYTVIASSRQLPGPWWVPSVLVLVAGGWVLALAALSWLPRPRDVERDAVVAAVDAVALLLESVGGADAVGPRRSLTAALTTAWDAVTGLRLREAGRDADTRRLLAVLNATTGVVEAAVSLTRTRRPVDPHLIARIRRIAVAVQAGQDPPPADADLTAPVSSPVAPAATGPVAALPAAHAAAETALRRAVRGLAVAATRSRPPAGTAASVSASSAPAGPSPDPGIGFPDLAGFPDVGFPDAGFPDGARLPARRERVRAALDRVVAGRTTLLVAVRVALCVAAAEIAGTALGLQRSYWVVLTVAVIIKPDFGSVFARAIQRGIGTVVGVVIGAGVLTLVPDGPWLLPFIAAFAALLPIAQVRNYGMFTTFLTPMVMVLIDSLAGHPDQLLETRLVDTLVGCAIVLGLGYAIWPETWRPQLGRRVAEAADAVAAYAHRGLRPQLWDTPPLRRRTYRRLSDVRTVLQQTLAEPGLPGLQAMQWLPTTVALERVTDAVTATAIGIQHGRVRVRESEAAAVEEGLRELAAAVREGRRPRLAALPEPTDRSGAVDPAVLDLAREVRTTVEAVRGPGPRVRRGLLRSRAHRGT